MAVMRLRGNGRRLPPHANVREDESEYVIKLDVSDFTENELTVETLGPVVTVRGDQLETTEDEGQAFCLHERLEETFRLPDDAAPDNVRAFFEHGTLELHARRRRLSSHAVPVEPRPTVVNPDATAV
jgi:HSP20 family molecular chaperone IbpA